MGQRLGVDLIPHMARTRRRWERPAYRGLTHNPLDPEKAKKKKVGSEKDHLGETRIGLQHGRVKEMLPPKILL